VPKFDVFFFAIPIYKQPPLISNPCQKFTSSIYSLRVLPTFSGAAPPQTSRG